MSAVPFNFSTLDDLRTALDSLQCGNQPSISTDTKYLSPLLTLATEFGSFVGKHGLENSQALASGCYRDIIIVLLEPTNSASHLPPPKMLANSETLKWVDRTLRRSSRGLRTWENTRIFDIRPFRNAEWREGEDDKTREQLDERAYRAFEEMIHLAEPDVVLVCQCQTTSAKNALAQRLSSSVGSAGTLRLDELLNRKTIIVQGFHPSYFTR